MPAPERTPPTTRRAETVLGATLALMSGYALHAPAAQRERVAQKLTANLLLLAHHPDLSERLRQLIAGLHAHWQRACEPADPPSPLH